MMRIDQQHPDEFVAAAARMTNDRDVRAIEDVFHPDATWTTVLDGVEITARGLAEIRRRWGEMCEFMRRRQLSVDKQLVVAAANTLVNEWTSGNARGIEVWRFDDAGQVLEQRLYGYLDVRPDNTLTPILRFLVTQPANALAIARARWANVLGHRAIDAAGRTLTLTFSKRSLSK